MWTPDLSVQRSLGRVVITGYKDTSVKFFAVKSVVLPSSSEPSNIDHHLSFFFAFPLETAFFSSLHYGFHYFNDAKNSICKAIMIWVSKAETRKYTKQKTISSPRSKFFSFYALDMKRKIGGDQIGNDSVLSNYKLHFVTGALERHYQQGVYNLLTCATIWNYVHFNIDAYFNHSVLSRIFVLGFDLLCVRILCSLVPKCLLNTFSCLRGGADNSAHWWRKDL